MSRLLQRVAVLLLVICLLNVSAFAGGFSIETPAETDAQRVLHGYDANTRTYQYVYFGSYPYYADGTEAPTLWRVLNIEEGYALLLSEYIIDRKPFHTEKVDQPEWNDYLIFNTMNDEMSTRLFTEAELSTLRWTDELGRLFILDNNEYMRAEYGFRKILTKPQPERKCEPTPYSAQMKETLLEEGCSWYWSRTCRHTAAGGYEYIIGYNGHVSMGGFLRNGGVRPACYVDLSKLDHISGSGTLSDPYTFEVID